jgi:hypothetical protein
MRKSLQEDGTLIENGALVLEDDSLELRRPCSSIPFNVVVQKKLGSMVTQQSTGL